MKFTNVHNLPPSLVDALTSDSYDLKNAPGNIISATTMIGPAKLKVLEARHDDKIEADVSESLWRFFGSACHSVVENANKGERLSEERMYLDMAGLNVYTAVGKKPAVSQEWYKKEGQYISAKIDIYDAVTEALQDYKVTSAWAWRIDKAPKPEWVAQLNIGAFMLRKVGFKVKRLSIIAIFRDWSASKTYTDYPDLPIPMKEIVVPMWDDATCLGYIRERVTIHMTARALPDEEIPECLPDERWAKDTTYAVMKAGRKSALAVKDSEADARTQVKTMQEQYPDEVYSIQVRPGEDTRCLKYCSVGKCGFCNYYNEHCVKVAEPKEMVE